MPRKTKEQKELENTIKEPKKTAKKASTRKNATTRKSATTTNKATTSKSSTTKKASTAKKTVTQNNTDTNKKSSATKKSNITKKKASATTKKSAKRTTKAVVNKKVEIVEYYDLPYRYNQTIVKVLAQTPTNLFIYWDISDEDRNTLKSKYGENFFETTKPILIVHNDTLGYSFEVEINDFANSWYLHVADSRCDYRIELGRRPIEKTEKLNKDYIYISTSNRIESPNDKILFDKNQKMVYFRDVKTGIQTKKSVYTMSFIRNMEKIYNIYDLYKAIYQNENVEGVYDLSNPSS